MIFSPQDRSSVSNAKSRVDITLSIGVACIATALLLAPLFIARTTRVAERWEDMQRRAQTLHAKVRTEREAQLSEALQWSTDQATRAWVEAVRNRAMEVEALLLVPGIFLVWMSRRERALRRRLQEAREGSGGPGE